MRKNPPSRGLWKNREAPEGPRRPVDISKRSVTQRKMPRCEVAAFRRLDLIIFVADSRPAKDTAENAAAIAVAAGSITGVLSITLLIALHEAATKGLRRSVPVIA